MTDVGVDDVGSGGAQRPRRSRKSTEALQRALLGAAAEVFARQGYGGASVKQIADLAATTPASIYRHYGSKADLFVAAVADPFLELLDDYTETYRQEIEARQDPRKLTEVHVGHLFDHLAGQRAPVLALISALGDPQAREPVRAVIERLNSMFEVFESTSVDVAEVGGVYDLTRVRLWHRLVLSMVLSVTALDSLFLTDDLNDRGNLVEVISDLVTFGIFDRTDDQV